MFGQGMDLLKLIYEILMTPGAPTDGPMYSNLPLTGAALPIVLISTAYGVFVLKIGPKWMKTREPFQLKYVLIAYNLAQILINLYMWFAGAYIAIFVDEVEFGCILKLEDDHPFKHLFVTTSYAYFLVKIIDYMDTIFFVLRKSFKQITFLHVYHHIMMTMLSYIFLRYYGWGGHVVVIGLLNSLVHAVMYTYYLLSALRPDTRKSLWWKKYITKLQLLQFALVLIHLLWPLLIRRDCSFPKIWLYLGILQAVLMLYLFGTFYRNTYLRKDGKSGNEAMLGKDKTEAKTL